METPKKHTPGPWGQTTTGPHFYEIQAPLESGGSRTVMVLQGPPTEPGKLRAAPELADVRLVAAAPELLEALRAALKALEYYDCRGTVAEQVQLQGCAALAKATAHPADAELIQRLAESGQGLP